MKQRNSWIWTMSALAVLSAPLTLDKVIGHMSTYSTNRSIAAFAAVPVVETPPAETTKVETNETSPDQPVEIPVQVAGELSDSEKLTKLNEDLSSFKAEAAALKADSDDLKSPTSAEQISLASQLEEQLKELSGKISPVADGLMALGKSETLKAAEMRAANDSLAEVEKLILDAKDAVANFNKSVADAKEAQRLKDEAEKKREEELAKTKADLEARDKELAERKAEYEQQKKDHDTYVCKAEARDKTFTKQIEELNQQQEKATLMFDLMFEKLNAFMAPNIYNHAVPGAFGGPGYFPQHPLQMHTLGQWSLPSMTYGMPNPWQEQIRQMQPITNNYYYAQPQAAPLVQNFDASSMIQPQQFVPFHQSSFGFTPVVDDSSRAEFGNLTQAI